MAKRMPIKVRWALARMLRKERKVLEYIRGQRLRPPLCVTDVMQSGLLEPIEVEMLRLRLGGWSYNERMKREALKRATDQRTSQQRFDDD